MTPTLCDATPQDAAAIAALHVAVWRQTYATLAPPEALARLDEAHRLRAWSTLLAQPDPRRRIRLAKQGAELVGFVACGPPADPTFGPQFGPCGEIKHLYVRADARRSGLGGQLLNDARRALADAGFDGAGLGVVRQNLPARAFYQRLRGTEAGDFTDPGPLWRSAMVLVIWDSP